jgi:hypothetical protein
VEALPNGADGTWSLFVAGRGGGDEGGVGFLYRAVVQGDAVELKNKEVFSDGGSAASHGYPLAAADLDGDGAREIIYGGFRHHENRDIADVRVFELAGERLRERARPFESLAIPLRVNAMDAGDLDGDGRADIVIAGRTPAPGGVEVSAVAWWSNGTVSHLILGNEHPSRLRTVLVKDLDGDGRTELISGGRLEIGGLWLADLRRWSLEQGRMASRDQFVWSLGSRMRLRTLSSVRDQSDHIKVGGRAERVEADGQSRWTGFLWEFSLDQDRMRPVGSPTYFDYGFDTRVRHLHLTDGGSLVASGFTKAKGKEAVDRGFVLLIR